MKDDPFSQLGGLDQQLFQEETPSKRRKQRNNERTLVRENEPTSETTSVDTSEHVKQPAPTRSNERRNEPMRTRVSAPTGPLTEPRPLERHSHDIFRDQGRWLNRVKVDIEERYGRRVTGNQIVQLAIEQLRDDYETNGDDSTLIRQLAREEPARTPSPPSGGPKDSG